MHTLFIYSVEWKWPQIVAKKVAQMITFFFTPKLFLSKLNKKKSSPMWPHTAWSPSGSFWQESKGEIAYVIIFAGAEDVYGKQRANLMLVYQLYFYADYIAIRVEQE